jgi:hypothetical protein
MALHGNLEQPDGHRTFEIFGHPVQRAPGQTSRTMMHTLRRGIVGPLVAPSEAATLYSNGLKHR